MIYCFNHSTTYSFGYKYFQVLKIFNYFLQKKCRSLIAISLMHTNSMHTVFFTASQRVWLLLKMNHVAYSFTTVSPSSSFPRLFGNWWDAEEHRNILSQEGKKEARNRRGLCVMSQVTWQYKSRLSSQLVSVFVFRYLRYRINALRVLWKSRDVFEIMNWGDCLNSSSCFSFVRSHIY